MSMSVGLVNPAGASVSGLALLFMLRAVTVAAAEPLGQSMARLVEAERAGAYAAAIIEPVIATAALLQAAGDHRAAIAQLRRAVHLRRIDEGLDTLTQIPLLERLLASQLQLGVHGEADLTQERLYQLRLLAARGAPDRLLAVQRYAEWHRERYLAGATARPYRHLLAIHDAHGHELERLASTADARHRLPHLYGQLQVEYHVASYAGGSAPVMQMRAGQAGSTVAATDLEGERFRLMRRDNYRNGRATVERILRELLQVQPVGAIEAVARAHIALGDWHLWWNNPGMAISSYRNAWQAYASDDDPATNPESLFVRPVALPALAQWGADTSGDAPLRTVQARVRFSVSRLGRARDVALLDMTASHADGADLVIQRMLREARFRPVLENGDAVTARDLERTFSVRY